VTLINADALKNKNHLNPEVMSVVEQKLAENPERQLKLIANLPYAVATPVISNLVATNLPWERMVVTIQYELAQRMIAQPKASSNYGALSIWLQAQCQLKMLKKLGPQVFWPKPNVDSGIVSILPDLERQAKIIDREFFHDLVRGVFTHRRKHLRVGLSNHFRDLPKATIDETIQQLGLQPDARAEQLDPNTFVVLSNRFRELVPTTSRPADTDRSGRDLVG
jgi:16S rRNA (adenine1518-N6/adenine1519-N6)-dimethyltransferase